uniref:NTR domain-containing protein n=2 Tax=Pyxicephalus adspersus TaxID=30357 RepID=A0AAV3AXR0_PYXAD|nr:TPA: hypothetical protein GDO54_005981 [Pyxicephalus adspersus]
MTMKLIIKPGTDIVQKDDKRGFISHSKCLKALNMEVGQDYVVWGVAKDLWNLGSGFSYIVTRDTWIEMWPNHIQCREPEYSELCDELDNFSEALQFNGCPN